MRFSILLIFYLMGILQVDAQTKVTLALAATAADKVGDGWILLMDKPEGIEFKEKQPFICKGIFLTSDEDTVTRGTGFIKAVYDSYLEGFMFNSKIDITPQQGDLCILLIEANKTRKDVFYKLARNGISFKSVSGDILFEANNNLADWEEDETERLIITFSKDIQYTGKAMLDQKDQQQQIIVGGDFNGKNLFTAMQEITEPNVLDFLKYVWARPEKYAGQTWSISEVFATWMTNGTPKIIGEIK